MSLRALMGFYNFIWMLESHSQQRLSWEDAEQARIARALIQHKAMMDANPSGQLGNAMLNDPDALARSGLL